MKEMPKVEEMRGYQVVNPDPNCSEVGSEISLWTGFSPIYYLPFFLESSFCSMDQPELSKFSSLFIFHNQMV
jgi:hypothetical protein